MAHAFLVSMADLPGSGRTPVKGTGERKYVVVVQIYALPSALPNNERFSQLGFVTLLFRKAQLRRTSLKDTTCRHGAGWSPPKQRVAVRDRLRVP